MDLLKKPRCKSIVWLYFGLKADDKGQIVSDQAICRLCRKVVRTKGGNTTNLRSHLRRRHQAALSETNTSSMTSGALFEAQGLDLSHDKFCEDLLLPQAAIDQSYISDTVLPPGEPWLHGGPSRATLSLPSCLCLCDENVSGPGPSSNMQMGEMKVYAKCSLHQGVLFGPFVGEVCRGEMPASLKYTWAIRDVSSFFYIDASDENKSNWMRYVTYTSSEALHNLVVFQFDHHIYYKVSQPITEGTELKVWVGEEYAFLLGLGIGDCEKFDVGDKETFLRPLQDIELVTLPEPSSSSLWSDHSLFQSPMPLIGDVMSVSNLDTESDSGLISGPINPSSSSSMISVPSTSSRRVGYYDFIPGTEKLLSNPASTKESHWNFFGFEPGPDGQQVDPSSAVCKLCLQHVGCKGTDLQNHLYSRHDIKLRDCNYDLMSVTAGKRCPQMATVTYAHVTEAITNFLIMDLQLPTLVEGKGFKKLVQTLQPTYKELPSHCQFESRLKKHHSQGKARLVQLLRKKRASENLEDTTDYTEHKPPKRGRPPGGRREVPHHVTLSMDIWIHNWQGNTDRYFTLWAHYIDSHFHFQNFALETQKLSDGGTKDGLHAVEAQGRAVAQEWGLSQPFMILIGGEGRKKMKPSPVQRENSEETLGSFAHPNSTTFLEKDDSVSSEELHGSEPSNSEERVPCFFSAIRDCIEEVMAHPVISKALSQFQRLVSTLFLPSVQCKGLLRYQVQSLLRSLTEQEEAELKSWAHSCMMWNKLYSALRTLIKHKSLFCNMVKKIRVEGSAYEDVSSESSSSGSSHANSTSSTSPSTWQDEWSLLEELCLVLKPLDVACRTLAKEAFPRLSLVKPILTGLLSRHLVAQPGESTSLLKDIKRMIRRRLESCYNNSVVNRTLCVTCSLDPQFHGLGFMETKERSDTFNWLKKEAVRIANEDMCKGEIKRGPSPASPESKSGTVRRSKRLRESDLINFRQMQCDDEDSDDADEREVENPGPQEGPSGMEFLLGDLFCSTPHSKQTSTEECIDMEMSVFRNNKGTSLGADPLQWWEMKAEQLPRLAAVARAYLASPAVAGNAAQEFMKEGVAYKQRANIPPESLDTLLFLHHNHTLTAGRGRTACGNDGKNTSLEKLL